MTLGWSIDAAARDSRMKRSRKRGPRPAAGRSASARPGGRGRAGARGRPRPCRRGPRSPDPVAGELVSLVQGGHRAFVQQAPQAPESAGSAVRRYPRPRRCAVRAPFVRPRGGQWRWAWPRRSSAGASASRRPWSPPPPPRRRSGCPWPCAARAQRDVGVVCLQMYAYITRYEMPNDDPERLRARVRMRLSRGADRAIGLGELPGLRLQRAFARREGEPLHAPSRRSCGATGCGSSCPHGTVAYLLSRRRDRFARGAAQIYAVSTSGSSATGRSRPRRRGTPRRGGRPRTRASPACAA